jgi:hypothetical protein
MRRLHRSHHDAGVTQCSFAEDVTEPFDERLVAAPVRGQGCLGASLLPRLQVSHHVAAAKGVDRLLRVADQHQRLMAVEGAVQDLPLHRVGVLELVDQHDGVARAHPCSCRLAANRVLQCVPQTGEQVLVVA